MTIAEKLLIAIIRAKEEKVLFKIQKRWLDTSEIKKLHFVLDYFREEGEFIGVKAFCSEFSLDAAEVDSRPAIYFKQLQKRYLVSELSEVLPELVKKISKEPEYVLSKLRDVPLNIDIDTSKSKDTLYSDTAIDRYEQYIEKIKNKGIVHLSTGNEILDSLFYGYQATDLITIGGRAGQRKCLSKGTRLRMFDGTVKNVEDVKVGDLLMGDDGSPRKVLKLYSGREQMYWVHQKKGMSYRVNESHILSLKNKRPKNIRETVVGKRKYVKSGVCSDEVVNITVRDYLTKSKTWKKYHKGWKAKLDFDSKEVLIDPYFLGVWLGDGSSREVSVTNVSRSVVSYVKKYASSLGLLVTPNDISYNISNGINSAKENKITKLFRQYNLLYNKRNKIDRGFKHIPKDYLINSREVRLQLLAGILDTDGHYDVNGNVFTITQKSKRLADDIAFLARGLGYAVTSTDKIAQLKERDYKCTVTDLSISGDFKDLPTKIKKKKPRTRLINKDPLVTGIEVVKDVVDDFYGFEIDGNHLFCLEDLTVTHNTWLICVLAVLAETVLPENSGEILFITNEISTEEIEGRMDAIRYRLPYSAFLSGTLTRADKGKYKKGLEELVHKKSKIRIIENCYALDELELKLQLYSPAMLFLDGSYLMEPKLEEGWQKITTITRGLKRFAKTYKVPIVNTTQLKRGSGKNIKSAIDGQADFAFSDSYNADSDLAFVMYQDKEMAFHQEFGLQTVKGRRIDGKKQLIFLCNLESMDLSFLIQDEYSDSEETPKLEY